MSADMTLLVDIVLFFTGFAVGSGVSTLRWSKRKRGARR